MNIRGEQIVTERENGSRRVQFICKGESKTRQSQKAETEINGIINKYKQTGIFTHIKDKMPFFGDASEVQDYKSAIDAVQASNAAFQELPAEIRAKFDNDPAKLVEFLSDSKNDEKAIKLGLKAGKQPSKVISPDNPDNAAEKASSKASAASSKSSKSE